jgi:hypothetical protein
VLFGSSNHFLREKETFHQKRKTSKEISPQKRKPQRKPLLIEEETSEPLLVE